MNKKMGFIFIDIVLIILSVISIIVIATTGYIYLNKNSSATGDNNNQSSTNSNNQSTNNSSQNNSIEPDPKSLPLSKVGASISYVADKALKLETNQQVEDDAYYAKYVTTDYLDAGQQKAILWSAEVTSQEYIALHQDDCLKTMCEGYAKETSIVFVQLKNAYIANDNIAEGVLGGEKVVSDGSFDYYATKINGRVWLRGESASVPGMKYARLARYITFIGNYQLTLTIMFNGSTMNSETGYYDASEADLMRVKDVMRSVVITTS